MFRTEAQRACVCTALCDVARLDEMWTVSGPTERAIALLESDGGPLSSGERIVLLSAWQLWSGEGKVTLGDVAYRLDGRNLRAIGTLLVAVAGGGAAIDAWLAGVERELAREGLR
jgi:hypothetical protein